MTEITHKKRIIIQAFKFAGLTQDMIMEKSSERYDALIPLKKLNKKIDVHGIYFKKSGPLEISHPTFSFETPLLEQPKGGFSYFKHPVCSFRTKIFRCTKTFNYSPC